MVEPYYQRGGITLYCGDALAVLPTLAAGSVDVVVTDPPWYTTPSNIYSRPGIKKLNNHAWKWAGKEWVIQASGLLKDGGHFYSFTGDDDLSPLISCCRESGLRVMRKLVWVKKNPSPAFTGRNYRPSCELAIFAVKGKAGFARKLSQKELRGWWLAPVVSGKARTSHPTQKPVSIVRTWIENSVPEGGLVLDPFFGSGTTALACLQTGRRCIGVEIDEGYCQIAVKRIEQYSNGLLPLEKTT